MIDSPYKCDCDVFRNGERVPCGKPAVESHVLHIGIGMRLSFCAEHAENHVETTDGVVEISSD